MIAADPRPLIAHVVYRFQVGGLENGVVNLINRLPVARYRHAVIALTEVTDFKRRVERDDVEFVSLKKPAGNGWRIWRSLYAEFRRLNPTILHTRNLASLEAALPAWLAGVPIRVHGEHGRDMSDLDGTSRKYQWVRRAYRPLVHKYVVLSHDLERYLVDRVGVPARVVRHVWNGVDEHRFRPANAGRAQIPGCPFNDPSLFVVGGVGRMEVVKDPANLVRGFVQALGRDGVASQRLRLVLVGDGSQRSAVEALVRSCGVAEKVWLAGERNDVPEILRGLDCFVLPSLAEGISNTLMEAMSSGLPVIATSVGANAEMVESGVSGRIVPRGDSSALAAALLDYLDAPEMARRHGRAGRQVVERRFGLNRMVDEYDRLYSELLRDHALACSPYRQGQRDARLTSAKDQ